MKLSAHSAIVLLLLAMSGLATAHHSYAQFDMSQFVLIEGRITAWHLDNPHSSMLVEAVDEGGDMRSWRFEGASRALAVRSGIWDDTFIEGELIKVVINRARTGGRAGAMCFGIKTTGQILPLHDGTCNAATVIEFWKSNGWLDSTRHLDSRPAKRVSSGLPADERGLLVNTRQSKSEMSVSSDFSMFCS